MQLLTPSSLAMINTTLNEQNNKQKSEQKLTSDLRRLRKRLPRNERQTSWRTLTKTQSHLIPIPVPILNPPKPSWSHRRLGLPRTKNKRKIPQILPQRLVTRLHKDPRNTPRERHLKEKSGRQSVRERNKRKAVSSDTHGFRDSHDMAFARAGSRSGV